MFQNSLHIFFLSSLISFQGDRLKLPERDFGNVLHAFMMKASLKRFDYFLFKEQTFSHAFNSLKSTKKIQERNKC